MTRPLTTAEENCLELLISMAPVKFPPNWNKDLLALPMSEANTGSLFLFHSGNINRNREFGQELCEYHFKDQDGIDVIASLNVDTKGHLLELDIWKADFSPLIQFPILPKK